MKAKALRPYIGEVVLIVWEDANGAVQWLHPDDMATVGLVQIESLGRLVRVEKDFVVTISDTNLLNGTVNSVGVIPTANIVKITKMVAA